MYLSMLNLVGFEVCWHKQNSKVWHFFEM